MSVRRRECANLFLVGREPQLRDARRLREDSVQFRFTADDTRTFLILFSNQEYGEEFPSWSDIDSISHFK